MITSQILATTYVITSGILKDDAIVFAFIRRKAFHFSDLRDLLDTCSAGGFGRQEGRGVVEKDAIDRLSRLTGRAMIAATANEKMAIEGAGGHGAFTFVLLEGLQGKADRLPEITCKWGYEQFPFSTTEGSSFTLIPKP